MRQAEAIEQNFNLPFEPGYLQFVMEERQSTVIPLPRNSGSRCGCEEDSQPIFRPVIIDLRHSA